MTTHEVAAAFAALCKDGNHAEAGARFWSDDIVSVEAMDGPMAVMKGRAAVQGKGEWWYANHEMHGGSTAGPFVNGEQFMLIFEMDITEKASGKRTQMREIGLYTVKDGKVVQETFFY